MKVKRSTLKRLLVAVTASLLFAIAIGVEEARACMCEAPRPEEQLQMAEAVFSGKVVDIEEDSSTPREDGPPLGGPITFEVEESWKGVSEEQQVVVRGYGEGSSGCGIAAQEGELYLVYARLGEEDGDGLLETTTCDGTKPLSAAQDDLRVLESTKITLPESGGPTLLERKALIVTTAALLGLMGVVVLLRIRGRRGRS